MSRKRRPAVVALTVLGVMVIGAVVSLTVPAPASFGTDPAGAFKPHIYDMPTDGTEAVAVAVAAKMGWHTSPVDDMPPGEVSLVAPSRLGLSKDRVVVTVRPHGRNALVEIHATAGSRGLDFGATEKHVRDLQAAMDERLPLGN